MPYSAGGYENLPRDVLKATHFRIITDRNIPAISHGGDERVGGDAVGDQVRGPLPIPLQAFGVVDFVNAGEDLGVVGHAGQPVHADGGQPVVDFGGQVEQPAEDGGVDLQPFGF